MEEKVIGFDMDGVLLDLSSVLKMWLQERYPAKTDTIGYLMDEPRHWDYEKALGIPTEVVAEYWRDAVKLAARPFPGASYYVNRFRDAGWNVQVVSHRKGPYATRGKKDLENWFEVDGLTYVSSTEGKLEVLQNLGVVAFVDDKFETAWDLGKAGLKSFLLNKPYNMSLDIEVPYTRIYSLEEYCQEFGV